MLHCFFFSEPYWVYCPRNFLWLVRIINPRRQGVDPEIAEVTEAFMSPCCPDTTFLCWVVRSMLSRRTLRIMPSPSFFKARLLQLCITKMSSTKPDFEKPRLYFERDAIHLCRRTSFDVPHLIQTIALCSLEWPVKYPHWEWKGHVSVWTPRRHEEVRENFPF